MTLETRVEELREIIASSPRSQAARSIKAAMIAQSQGRLKPDFPRAACSYTLAEMPPFWARFHDTGHGPDDLLDQEKPEEIRLELSAPPKGESRYYRVLLTVYTKASRPREAIRGAVAILMEEIEKHLGTKLAGKFKRLPYHLA